MRPWTEGFHQSLREVLHDGQLDMFGEMEMPAPFRPNVVCRGCGAKWGGEDARASLAKAIARRCWFVSNRKVKCPKCLPVEESK